MDQGLSEMDNRPVPSSSQTHKNRYFTWRLKKTNMLCYMCCKFSRPFSMHVTDSLGKEVMRGNHEFTFCPLCSCKRDVPANTLAIEAPVGQIIGYVHIMFSDRAFKYAIADARQVEVLLIQGPLSECTCTSICTPTDTVLDICTTDEKHQIGKLTKKHLGFTLDEKYEITFPMDLDVKIKALVLSTVYLHAFVISSGRRI